MSTAPKKAEKTLVGLLKEAQATSATLLSRTDLLNRKLIEIEAALVALNLGVSAVVPLVAGDFEGRLAFRKYDHKWGLVVLGHETVLPLLNAPRAQRIVAATFMDALVAALLQNVQNENDDVLAATVKLDVILADLGIRS